MRSNNKPLLVAAMVLGGCSSGWWQDAPAVAATPAAAVAAQPGQVAPRSDYPPPSTSAPRSYDRMPPAQAVRYDNVGYAVWSNEAGGVAAAHRTLPPGSFAEVTALDTGKTILVPITAVATGGSEIELSGAAAAQLGFDRGGSGGVRVRVATPNGGDLAALNAGRPAAARADTPPVLLNALRKKLAGMLGRTGAMPPPIDDAPVAEGTPPRGYVPSTPARATRRPPAESLVPTAGAGYYVQVAALSDLPRARVLARQLGGSVSSEGRLHRVRRGPYPSQRAAQTARDELARRGYADARIVRQDR